jgi:serine/threonine-protein kinase PknG
MTEPVWCHGQPVGPIGFCEVCGRRRVPVEPPPADPAPSTESTRRSVEFWGGEADFHSLPAVEVPDPEKLVLADPDYPEQHRFCGHCGDPVGRAYAGEQAFAEGFCESCGEWFSFLPKLSRGDRVGDRYDVLGCFARGGLGWVYLAADSALAGQHVALKGVINSGSAVLRSLARVERDVLTRLDHPNIVRISDFAEHPVPGGGEPDTYLVMEYVGGRSLQDILVKGPAPRVDHVIVYGRAILAALGYLHGEGLLYCDMKPDNVIHGDKRVKVIDLGAARPDDGSPGAGVGTENFQAPAHELTRHGLTVRSDLYTVGRTLEALLDAAAPDPDPARVAGGLDSLRRVLERAVAPFERRFATASEMAEQLDGVRREILSLRDERPRPVPSALFEDTADLLDTGLGAVPGLDRWAGGEFLRGQLDAGLPAAAEGAAWLPIPRIDPDDPGAEFIAGAGAHGPQRWLDKLALFDGSSVEIEFARTRALIALANRRGAAEALSTAEKLLGTEATRDWRTAWHHGLLALVRCDAEHAETAGADEEARGAEVARSARAAGTAGSGGAAGAAEKGWGAEAARVAKRGRGAGRAGAAEKVRGAETARSAETGRGVGIAGFAKAAGATGTGRAAGAGAGATGATEKGWRVESAGATGGAGKGWRAEAAGSAGAAGAAGTVGAAGAEAARAVKVAEAIEAAEDAFGRVHWIRPGELAPKLALGFCAELRAAAGPVGTAGTAEDEAVRVARLIQVAEDCYRSVWHRDHSQVSAAFGLARCYLRSRGRDAAVAVLDTVPPVSRHYDAARIAAVRIRAGRLPSGPPTRDDLADAARRLPEVYLDPEAQDRLETLVREAALDTFDDDAGGGPAWTGGALLGEPVTENGVRALLEQSLRRLAERARDRNEHGVLVDLANSVRPKTGR